MAKQPAKSTDITAAGATISSESSTGGAPDAPIPEMGETFLISAGPTVLVKGPAKGRWRIGQHFTAEPTSIQARELNEAQWLALSGDPELLVTVVDPPD
jgi:hypothetical protein